MLCILYIYKDYQNIAFYKSVFLGSTQFSIYFKKDLYILNIYLYMYIYIYILYIYIYIYQTVVTKAFKIKDGLYPEIVSDIFLP